MITLSDGQDEEEKLDPKLIKGLFDHGVSPFDSGCLPPRSVDGDRDTS